MKTLLRFGLVGACTTLLDLTLFNVLLALGLGVGPSHALSTSVILPISFAGQRRAFLASDRRPWVQALKFVLVTVVGAYGVQICVLAASVHLFGSSAPLPANLAKLSAMAVGIAWNFALFRWFVFRSPPDKEGEGVGGVVGRWP